MTQEKEKLSPNIQLCVITRVCQLPTVLFKHDLQLRKKYYLTVLHSFILTVL